MTPVVISVGGGLALSKRLKSLLFIISFIYLSTHILIFRLAEYIEQEPARLAAKAEAQKTKLENLERKLGITDPSSSKKPSDPNAPPDVLAGKKHRFDDTEYLEKSQELKDNVKNAVFAGLLKKKKTKLSHPPADSPEGVKGKGKEKETEKEKEKQKEKEIVVKEADKSPLVTAPLPTAVSLDAIGA